MLVMPTNGHPKAGRTPFRVLAWVLLCVAALTFLHACGGGGGDDGGGGGGGGGDLTILPNVSPGSGACSSRDLSSVNPDGSYSVFNCHAVTAEDALGYEVAVTNPAATATSSIFRNVYDSHPVLTAMPSWWQA